MTLLIDGDMVVYRCAHSVETRWYTVKGDDKCYPGKKDIKLAYGPKAYKALGNKIVLQREAEGEWRATHAVEMYILSLITATNDTKVKVFLTDTDIEKNFRFKLNPEYKQNRKDSVKPIHYAGCREHLIDWYKAVVVSGIEADDAICMAQTKDTIAVSGDKDFRQFKGKHFCMNKHKRFFVKNPGELQVVKKKRGKVWDYSLTGTGFKWFCAQMLRGDIADNIKGTSRDYWFASKSRIINNWRYCCCLCLYSSP